MCASPRGVVANVLDCNIVINEFELQSCYYIDFRTNTLGKDINSLKGCIWLKITHEGYHAIKKETN